MDSVEEEQTVEYWKSESCKDKRNLQKLKELSHKALKDYDDLLAKYNENQVQFKKLSNRLEQRENDISQIQTTLEPVTQGIIELQTKCSVESGLRLEAEKYAKQIHKQNVDLKRQSQLLVQKISEFEAVEINFEDFCEPSDAPDETEHFQKIITDLEKDIIRLKKELKIAKDDRDEAIEKHDAIQEKLQMRDIQLRKSSNSLSEFEKMKDDFQRVSVLAVGEIQELQKKLEMENQCRKAAMNYASKMHRQRETMARQSQALIGSALAHDQLAKALGEIEDLTTKIEMQKEQYSEQIKELEAKVKVSGYKELERELEKSDEKKQLLEQQLEDSHKLTNNLKYKVKLLSEQLENAKKSNIPAPPPPPPPPPPSIFKPLVKLVMKSKKPKPAVKEEIKGFDEVLSEMMKRIKTEPARHHY
ncbi:shootin-1-like isoform X2 [Tubulanus polymorphus]|uniref:shootin-1-like isoform X2 n=1 Tax=Tubulanus polymorphus TaxID=672921 RepID=UPI003DA57267